MKLCRIAFQASEPHLGNKSKVERIPENNPMTSELSKALKEKPPKATMQALNYIFKF